MLHDKRKRRKIVCSLLMPLKPTRSEKSTNFNVHLITFKHYIGKNCHKILRQFLRKFPPLFLSLQVFVDQTRKTITFYTFRHFRPPRAKNLKFEFNPKPSLELTVTYLITKSKGLKIWIEYPYVSFSNAVLCFHRLPTIRMKQLFSLIDTTLLLNRGRDCLSFLLEEKRTQLFVIRQSFRSNNTPFNMLLFFGTFPLSTYISCNWFLHWLIFSFRAFSNQSV